MKVLRCLTAVAVTAGVAGCAPATSSSGAPPWIVCGVTLDDSPAGETSWDAAGSERTLDVTARSVVGIGLVTSHDCDHGATLSFAPGNAATVLREATTSDRKVAAAIINPTQATFDVLVARADGTVATVHVALGPDFTPTP